MRKFFCALMVVTVLIVVGCTSSSLSVTSTDSEITIEAENAGGDDTRDGDGSVVIPEGAALNVNADITRGKLIIRLGNREHVVYKSGETFIDVPPGGCDLNFIAADGLTGKITLRPLPKV